MQPLVPQAVATLLLSLRIVPTLAFAQPFTLIRIPALVRVGLAIALYGQALALRRPVVGGAWMGAGAAVAFLCQGFMGPAWIAIAALLLVALGPQFRSRR